MVLELMAPLRRLGLALAMRSGAVATALVPRRWGLSLEMQSSLSVDGGGCLDGPLGCFGWFAGGWGDGWGVGTVEMNRN